MTQRHMARFRAVSLALLGLVAVAQAGRHLAEVRYVKDESKEFDYFMLVRQWPGNYCSKHACPLLRDLGYHFTIHGLWPNYADGTWPQFCDPSYKFDVDELEDLEDDLEAEWPSFYNDDETFWEHEWSKHGTCALNVLRSEHKFFKTVLKLHWKYDLAAALRAKDIVPRKDTVYRAADVAAAIEERYGARPLVHCYGEALSEIWMCIGKDLKPFDCEPPKADRAACSQLTIPPLPHSGGGSGSSSSATAQRGAVHASEMEWAEPRVQQEQQEEEQAVAWASTASATGGVEAVADLANLEDDREEDGEEEHEDEHDNDSDDGDDDDDKEEEEEEEDEDDVQDSVWDGVNQQADSAVPAAAYHTSDSASFDPSSASAGAVRPQDSIFEALSATWAATRAALEARLLGLMRAAGHDLPLTAEEARAQAAAAAAFQQHAAAAAAAFGRAGAAQQREAGESRRSDGASDPMDSVYSLLLATAMTRDGAVQRGAADVEAAAGTADATAADMNADPELLGLLGQADAEAEALGVAALARSLDLASGGALTRAVRADAAGGRSSSGTTAGMSAASGGVQEAGQAQQPEQAEGKEGQQQEGEGIFAYVMRMVTVVAAHGSGGMPGRGCAHKGKGKGAMAGSRVGDISSRQFMWQSRIREQGDVMRDEAEAQAEAGRAQVQQRAVPGHGGGGAAAASASGARHEHPLPVRHASVSDGDDEVRWDVLVVQQGQQQSEQGAGLDVGDAAVLAVQQQPFSVAPLLLVACQVAGGAAVLCAAVVLAVAAWGRGRGGAGGEGMEEPLLAGERGEQQQEGEERGAKEAVVSVH